MKAGGISVYRAALPVLGMGLVASLLLYGMQEWVLPAHQQGRGHGQATGSRAGRRSPRDQFDRRWVLASDERFYNFDYIVERDARSAGVARAGRRRRVLGLRLLDLRRRPEDLAAARAALREPRRLELRHPQLRARARLAPHDRARRLGFQPFQTPARARDRARPGRRDRAAVLLQARGEALGHHGLRRAARATSPRSSRAGFDVAKLRVQLHRKLAFPMVGLVMTLLAVPFSFVVARRGALYGIGIAIVIAIVYWAVLGIFEALGNSALSRTRRSPPGRPNLLFGAAGLYLILTLAHVAAAPSGGCRRGRLPVHAGVGDPDRAPRPRPSPTPRRARTRSRASARGRAGRRSAC